eukprot:scaffold94585_cov60-Phaeocystis_antarctica.AAC.1
MDDGIKKRRHQLREEHDARTEEQPSAAGMFSDLAAQLFWVAHGRKLLRQSLQLPPLVAPAVTGERGADKLITAALSLGAASSDTVEQSKNASSGHYRATRLVFTDDRERQESYTGGNSKEAVQPALSRRSSGFLECIQCTPMSEAPG